MKLLEVRDVSLILFAVIDRTHSTNLPVPGAGDNACNGIYPAWWIRSSGQSLQVSAFSFLKLLSLLRKCQTVSKP